MRWWLFLAFILPLSVLTTQYYTINGKGRADRSPPEDARPRGRMRPPAPCIGVENGIAANIDGKSIRLKVQLEIGLVFVV
jgi:hypothetical protein